MPSCASHILIMERTIEALRSSSDENHVRVGEFLHEHRHLAFLGAMGPDPFFVEQDQLQNLEKAIRSYAGLRDKVTGFFQQIHDELDGISETEIPGVGVACEVGEGVVRTLEGTAQAVLLSTQTHILELVTLIATTLAQSVSPNLTPLHSIAHFMGISSDGELLNGVPETEWNWGHVMHFQASGSFVRLLLRDIIGQEHLKDVDLDNHEELAYALGFLCHVTGDAMGHAYVNQVVGGPARNHNWRHALAERVIDKNLWRVVKNRDVSFDPLADLMSPSDLERDVIARRLHNACSELYERRNEGMLCGESRPIPPPLRTTEISDRIENFLAAVALLNDLEVPFPEAPDVFTPTEAIEEALESISGAANFLLPNDINSIFDVIRALLGAAALAAYAGWAMTESLSASAVSTTTGILLTPLYMLQVALWYIYNAIRRIYVYLGLLYPDDLMMSEPYAHQFLDGLWDPYYPHKRDVLVGVNLYEELRNVVTGALAVVVDAPAGSPNTGQEMIEGLQRQLLEALEGIEDLNESRYVIDRNPLIYPFTDVEEPRTLSAPFTYRSPEVLLEGRFSRRQFAMYAGFQTPDQTEEHSAQFAPAIADPSAQTFLIGDCVGLSRFAVSSLISGHHPENAFEDWNLCADRGYGHKLWLVPDGRRLLDDVVEIIGYCENPISG
ncbi:zinc dependent phospholipase C family protein [Thermodesulfobacteriota bacterium]